MKKLLALVLACIMMMSCASALAYDGTAPIADGPVNFSMITTNGASLDYDWQEWTWWNKVMENANVTIDMEMIDSSSYNDVIKPRMAAGLDLPDLIQLRGSFDEYQAYIDAGMLMDLTDLYEKLGVNYKAQFEKNPTLKGQITTIDGGMYIMPYIYTTDSNMRCMMINARWAEALGMKVEDIKTIDDYYNYLVAVKNGDPNGNGDTTDEVPLFLRPGYQKVFAMMWGLDLGDGSGYQLIDGKVVNTYTDDRYLEYLQFMKKLYDEGLLYNEFATCNYDTQQSLMTTDRIGSMVHFISNCTGYSQSIDPEWNIDTDEPIMVPVILEGPYGDKYCYGRNVYGGAFAINADCENPEEVFAFCDYLQSEEVGKLTWYGIEGADYNVVDGEYVFTEVYKANKDEYLTNAGYNAAHLPSYQYDYMSKQCDGVRKAAKELAPYVMNPSVVVGFTTMEETEILNMYRADLATYFDETNVGFIMGTKSLDEWESYKATVESMGINEVLAVYQGIMDRSK